MKKIEERYKGILIFLFVLPVAFVFFCLVVPKEKFTWDDWISVGAAILTYIGTTILSYIAITQANNANKLSEQVLELTKLEYKPIFSVVEVRELAICNCEPREMAKNVVDVLNFCFVDQNPPSCRGYQIKIKNYSKQPITEIRIYYTYPIGRKQQTETLDKTCNVVITPNDEYEFIVCNTPKFKENRVYVTFRVECYNDYGNKTSVELELHGVGDNENNKMRFKCKSLINEDAC